MSEIIETPASGETEASAARRTAAGSEIALGRLPEHIGFVLRIAQIAVFQDFHRAVAALDLRPAQYSVLIVLRENPGVRASQVAEALGIKRTNFVPLLDGLERRGLTTRERLARDRRAFALFLTEAGMALLGRAEEAVDAHERNLAALLGDAGKATLLDLLARLTAASRGPLSPRPE